MNNVIGLVLGITEPKNPEWKYINRKGHVITCTKKQFQSYFKKRKVDHAIVMRKTIGVIFAPCPLYRWLKEQ